MKLTKALFIPLLLTLSSVTSHALEGFTATDLDVKNAKCIYPVLSKKSDLEKYFHNKERNSEKNNFELLGFHFKNESPFLVKHFKDLIEITDHTLSENEPQSLNIARKQCQSVRCALSVILGKEESLKALYLLDKYRFNVSPLKYYETQNFTSADLDLILETMSLIPPHLLPLQDIQQLSHSHKDAKRPDNEYAVSSIELYHSWDKGTTEQKKYILFHEIAHNWSNIVSEELDESQEWLKITGWIKIPGGFTVGWEHPFQSRQKMSQYPWASEYASVNSWEDFAESVSSYRFTPQSLFSKSPARYNFIKNKIFGGIEFKDNKNCQLNSKAQKLENLEKIAVTALDKKVNFYNANTANIDIISLRKNIEHLCVLPLQKAILNKSGAIPEFHSCFHQAMSKALESQYDWITLDRQTALLNSQFKKAKVNFIDQWLSDTYIKENMNTVRWNATADYNCQIFAKNFKALYIQSLEIPDKTNYQGLQIKSSLAPTIGYWICADAKLKKIKTAAIEPPRLQYLKSWIYPRMGL